MVASLTIAAVLVMALVANWTVARVEIHRPRTVGAVLVSMLAVGPLVPVGTIAFENRAVESVVYSLLVFSPNTCTSDAVVPDGDAHQPDSEPGRRGEGEDGEATVSQGAGATVAATMMAASPAGTRVFATGGSRDRRSAEGSAGKHSGLRIRQSA